MQDLLDAQTRGVVLGLKGISSTPVARLDIDDLLLNHPDTFNLFILAVSELQQDGASREIMAWQQITGIHGLPMALWDGVSVSKKSQGNGYCAHGRPTFPTWHRPYLAMMEQTIYVKMADIAGRYHDKFKARYQKALAEFRLPYWDYYRPRGKGNVVMPGIIGPGGTTSFNYDFSVPQIFILQEVMIHHYDSSTDELKPFSNPMTTFTFPKSGGLNANDWALAQRYATNQAFSEVQTVRYPTSSSDDRGNVQLQSNILNRQREANVTYILHMIRNYDSYATFASQSVTPGSAGNLENIHGAYHGYIGGDPSHQGHMSIVPLSSFDPIFWMHHCLIDRWLAIWQGAHPTKWYDGQFRDNRLSQPVPIGPLSKENAMPFRHPQQGTFWNGDLSRDTKTFGYIYNDAVKGTPDQVIDNFAYLYEWATRNDSRSDPPEEMEPLPVQNAQVYQYNIANRVSNIVSETVGKAPQVLFSALESAKLTRSTNTGAKDSAADGSTVVETAPVAPGESASQVAFTNLESSGASKPPANIDESQYTRQWFVDDIVKRLALNGSFAIYYFVGKVDDTNISTYATQPTMAGYEYVFASSREICDNCGEQDDENIEITGTQIITPMLLDYIKINKLPDLSPANVVPFLIENLKWRIVDSNGERQNPRTVDGFTVGVSSSLTPNTGTGAPIYEEYPQVIEEIIRRSS